MFARKLCVRLGHVHGPHDQDQQGQHKDVSRRSRNGPSRQCRWESQAADRKDAEKQKASDIEVAAQELEEGNGQKETPENVNEAEEASIDLKDIAESAVEIVNIKSERENRKRKQRKTFHIALNIQETRSYWCNHDMEVQTEPNVDGQYDEYVKHVIVSIIKTFIWRRCLRSCLWEMLFQWWFSNSKSIILWPDHQVRSTDHKGVTLVTIFTSIGLKIVILS